LEEYNEQKEGVRPLTTSALFKRDLPNKMQEAEATFHKDLEALELTIDPMIRQYKVKAVDMALAHFEKYQQCAIAAGFISPPSQSSISPPSLSISTSDRSTIPHLLKQDDRPLESSDINWKLLPKWDATWNKEQDLVTFLRNMANFRKTVTHSDKCPFADSVACQCWLSTF